VVLTCNLQDIETGYEETDLDDSEDNNVFLQNLRAKCVIQLLLLSALDSIQVQFSLFAFQLDSIGPFSQVIPNMLLPFLSSHTTK
jgi:hypothetical protein